MEAVCGFIKYFHTALQRIFNGNMTKVSLDKKYAKIKY